MGSPRRQIRHDAVTRRHGHFLRGDHSSSVPQRRVPPFPRDREVFSRTFPSASSQALSIGAGPSRFGRRTKESHTVIDRPRPSATKALVFHVQRIASACAAGSTHA
jgi:hypothetical protein